MGRVKPTHRLRCGGDGLMTCNCNCKQKKQLLTIDRFSGICNTLCGLCYSTILMRTRHKQPAMTAVAKTTWKTSATLSWSQFPPVSVKHPTQSGPLRCSSAICCTPQSSESEIIKTFFLFARDIVDGHTIFLRPRCCAPTTYRGNELEGRSHRCALPIPQPRRRPRDHRICFIFGLQATLLWSGARCTPIYLIRVRDSLVPSITCTRLVPRPSLPHQSVSADHP